MGRERIEVDVFFSLKLKISSAVADIFNNSFFLFPSNLEVRSEKTNSIPIFHEYSRQECKFKCERTIKLK